MMRADENIPERVAYVCVGRLERRENLSVPKPLRTGTGAIRQEFLINSHLSAPQAQCGKHFA